MPLLLLFVQSTQRQDVIHALFGAAYARGLRDALPPWPPFDPARAAVERSLAKELILLAIVASDLVGGDPGPTLKHPERGARAHARFPYKDEVRERTKQAKRRSERPNRVHGPGGQVITAAEAHLSARTLIRLSRVSRPLGSPNTKPVENATKTNGLKTVGWL